MAWSDEPTEEQLNAVYRFLDRHSSLQRDKALAATNYLKEHATRKQVSDELGRLRKLSIERKLNRDSCFDSAIWEGFEFDGDDLPTNEQNALIFAIFRRHMPIGRAAMASSWLGQHATRREVSGEIDRIKALDDQHSLDRESCFDSAIWDDFRSNND